MGSDFSTMSSESSDFKTALKDVPIAIKKILLAIGFQVLYIKDDPRAVIDGRDTYRALSKQGK